MKKFLLSLGIVAALMTPAMARNHEDQSWRGHDHHRGFFHEFLGRNRWFDVDDYWRYNPDPYYDGYVLGPDERFFPDGRCVIYSRIDQDGNEVRYLRCYR
jgi:hypothetical protein